MDKTKEQLPQLNTSVKKIAMLSDENGEPNGDACFITGPGLAVAGTVEEIDVTDISAADEKRVRENLHQLKITKKGDRINIKAGSKTVVVENKDIG